MTLYSVFQVATAFLQVVSYAILLYCVLSWFRPRNKLYLWLECFVRPFVSPFRRLSMWLTARFRIPLDFSCWFAMIGLYLISDLLWGLYRILRLLR